MEQSDSWHSNQYFFHGKLIGEDEFGNKYYQDKNNKRWVIYKNEIEATKIPQEWYSWIHHLNNKLENNREFKKFDWQKNIHQI